MERKPMAGSISDLPMLPTPQQVADVLGLTKAQVRGLIAGGKIAHIRVGARLVIPRDAIETFIIENTVQPCRDETRDRAFASSRKENVSTSSGLMPDAAASAQRALRIASSLKPR
ncbi:helix-turn-helix domain-containing protein [Bradyrhizobium sp. 187]|uniref:helix-turn-helix domain-containing protein n=1 Tax=Bradyrhizobium sp. 187 TaxID=2782655 RepID=UPI00200025B0|nr:helix-turn-helix domain-containing protein [Bradyrhizobium sp. 187]UPJ72799.1 helix-turn-helix domain-containing protein [Bradyrhizobium sp. 187]